MRQEPALLQRLRRHAAAILCLLALAFSAAAPAAIQVWDDSVLRQAPAWYATREAHALADSVIQYQSPQGGWPKSTNLAVAPRTPQDIPPPGGGRANSFDNDATTVPMMFLVRVVQAQGDARHRAAFDRGLVYVLQAQYANGGWPQFYPLREAGSYYNHITFNDDAMVLVLKLLQGVAGGREAYAFTSPAQREAAAAAMQRGLDLVLRTQIRQQGRLTAWCAQYDAKALEPAWARKYEPPSISGNESAGIVWWLMSLERPGAEVVAAVDTAVAWLRSVAVDGLRYERFVAADGERDGRVTPDAQAPPLWARFYELGTERPLFMGRDSVPRYALAEIERERRAGYSYYTRRPAAVLEAYPAWKARVAVPAQNPSAQRAP